MFLMATKAQTYKTKVVYEMKCMYFYSVGNVLQLKWLDVEMVSLVAPTDEKRLCGFNKQAFPLG